ncbi:AraC family transcriptional regulator, partial [Streptomyces sp. NPDC005918]
LVEAGPVPSQTRRTAAASALGPSASVPTDPGKPSSDAYAPGRAPLPGQRSAP